MLVDRSEQRLGDDEQQEQCAEYRCGHDHSQRDERGHTGIARDQRHGDQHRHQQPQRVGPGRGDEGIAAIFLDGSQPEDEMNQERGRNGREQRVCSDGDDEGREQGLVDDLQDDQHAERARGPDQVIIEAAGGFIVLLHQPALRVLGRKQPARNAMAECGGGHAGDEPLSNLLQTNGQQPESGQGQQCCEAGERCSDRKPGEHPQCCPSLGRTRIGRFSDNPWKPPSGQRNRERDNDDDDQSRRRPAWASMLLAPGVEQRLYASQLDRQCPVDLAPEGGVEDARASREQFVGVKRVAFLGDAIPQLVGPDREHAGLFQLTVDIVELRSELLALAGNLRAFGRRILGRRGPELLQAVLGLVGARLEPVDFFPQDVGRRIELVAKAGEGLGGDVLAVDRGLDLVQ